MNLSKFFIPLSILFSLNVKAQYTAIPDNAFEQHLIDLGYDSGPIDGQVLTSNINTVTSLTFTAFPNPVSNLTGIEDFVALEKLDCSGTDISSVNLAFNTNLTKLAINSSTLSFVDVSNLTNLTNLLLVGSNMTLDVSTLTALDSLHFSSTLTTPINISNNINLIYLNINNTYFTTIDLSNNINLEEIYASVGELTSIDVSNAPNLTYLRCYDNNFTELDLSSNPNLVHFYCGGDPNLTYVNLKNGNNNILHDSYLLGYIDLPLSVTTICVDDVVSDFSSDLFDLLSPNIILTQYCSLNPAMSNQITGKLKIDANANGCDINDDNYEGALIQTTDGTNSYATFTNSNSEYTIYVGELGTYTTTVSSNTNYYTASSSNNISIFTTYNNQSIVDFCLDPIPNINDLSIAFVNTPNLVPGGNFTHTIKYQNNGTTTLSGNVNLKFDDSKINFINASETVANQNTGTINIEFTNIAPNESRTISYDFIVETPPTANIDDSLSFSAVVTPIVGDSTEDDNSTTTGNLAIGPFDPNDITVVEGYQVHIENIDDYLHYNIRFQNTGTAPSINVVVQTTLDSNLDWSTLEFIDASHAVVLAIENDNDIEFIFENINLPDSTTDEAGSHGTIAYRIKPINTIAIDDLIEATANIYFDYNEAVVTNTAHTKIVATGVSLIEQSKTNTTLYPNPTNNILNLKSANQLIKVELFNSFGKLVLTTSSTKNIDISNLPAGMYFCKVTNENQNIELLKMIKQ